MTTEIKISTKPLERWQRKVILVYRKGILRSLANSIDNIRFRAIKFIIPNIVGKKKSPYRMAKEQPSVSGKLTERTGRLIKMLQERGKWNIKNKIASFDSPSFKGITRVTTGYKTTSEMYKAILRVDIDTGHHLVGYEVGTQIVKTIEGRKERIKNKVTEKQLEMRFKHEKGIRGQRRPFIEPAAKQERFNTRDIIRAKMAELKRF